MSLRLPSTVTDTKYLWMPPEKKVVDDDKEWEKYGKWILKYPGNDLFWADKVWTDLQPLVSNGSLPLLKASTAAFEHSGVILCYTRPGQEGARKAAEAIRDVVDYKYIMYHKSNKVTIEGKALRFGDRIVAQYMHTALGHFYERDAIQRWKFVDNQDESGISGTIREDSKARNLPSELLTATRRKYPGGYFQLVCKLQKGEDGLVEARHVWSTVNSLKDDGNFTTINKWEVPGTTDRIIIFCNVKGGTDLHILINIAKLLYERNRFPSIIPFYIKTSGGRKSVKYIFTPRGELYENDEDANTDSQEPDCFNAFAFVSKNW